MKEFYWFLRWWMADRFLSTTYPHPNAVYVDYLGKVHRAPKSRRPYTGAALPPWIIGWGYWLWRKRAIAKAQKTYDEMWIKNR